MMWTPVGILKPDKSSLELDATDPSHATLRYSETFSQIDQSAVDRAKAMIELFGKILGDKGHVEVSQEGATIGIKATGPSEMLAQMITGEFLFQSFEKNPERQFWQFVAGSQLFMSTVRLPIASLYEEYTGEPLEQLEEASYQLTAINAFLNDPTRHEAPQSLIDQFRQLGAVGKETMFGYVLGYAKRTNEGLASIGKSLNIPQPGMTDVVCGQCGGGGPAPNSYLETDPLFTCPKCGHEGHVKEGKF